MSPSPLGEGRGEGSNFRLVRNLFFSVPALCRRSQSASARLSSRHVACTASTPIEYEEGVMPEKETLRRAAKDRRQGKSASTQAGEFVREEMHHIREGKHGASSPEQAIAIGLSKARRAGVNLRPPRKGRASEKTRRSAQSAYRKGQRHEPILRRQSQARSK